MGESANTVHVIQDNHLANNVTTKTVVLQPKVDQKVLFCFYIVIIVCNYFLSQDKEMSCYFALAMIQIKDPYRTFLCYETKLETAEGSG